MSSRIPRRVLIVAAASVAAVFLATGCGGDKKKLAKVSGKVTLDGKALDGASVVFNPVDGGRPATGVTGADGHFTLTTYTSGDGAQLGEHKVTITKTTTPSIAAPIQPGDAQGLTNAMKEYESKRKELAKTKQTVIPESYGDPQKTPLKAVVPAEGEIEFSLRSAGGT
jgi:hypothetical protein